MEIEDAWKIWIDDYLSNQFNIELYPNFSNVFLSCSSYEISDESKLFLERSKHNRTLKRYLHNSEENINAYNKNGGVSYIWQEIQNKVDHDGYS
jgi:hypothetical protein